jgi:NSS family neurotransmitter:Na+ symporter
MGVVVCLGYNKLYFEMTLPNGTTGQILDVMDYVSNNLLMPIISLGTCILIGWVVGPDVVINEVTQDQFPFERKRLYIVMIRFVAPVLLFILLLQAFGLI